MFIRQSKSPKQLLKIVILIIYYASSITTTLIPSLFMNQVWEKLYAGE